MKVGDLVELTDRTDFFNGGMAGVVLRLSRTGHHTTSVEVLFFDGGLAWFDTRKLKVINESR